MKAVWYNKKWSVFFIHAAVWLLFFSIPFLLHSHHVNSLQHLRETVTPRVNKLPVYDFDFNLLIDAILLACFYLNVQVLIPKFFYTRKYLLYGFIHSIIVFFLLVMDYLYFTIEHSGSPFYVRGPVFLFVFPYLLIIACSMAYKTIRDKLISDQESQEKENENLKTELSLLRSQVSPHFMFNVLNNMVSLARLKSDQLESSLIKLSSLMRYMLYEVGEDKVALVKEIEYLKSFIDLQKQRFEDAVTVDVTIKVPKGNTLQIEPMLLIPFVENAFKHGTGVIDDAQIHVLLEVQGHDLLFKVSNRFDPDSVEVKDKTSGIGLNNVQRRLNLLYRGNYNLSIDKNNEWFITSLQIKLA